MDRIIAALLLSLSLGLLPACSEPSEGAGDTDPSDATVHEQETPDAADEGDSGYTLIVPDASEEQPDAGPYVPPVHPGTSIVWLHTGTTLYKGDLAVRPFTYEKVGDFVCDDYTSVVTNAQQLTSITDLAVDQDENLFGVTARAILPLAIENGEVRCTDIWPFPSGTARVNGLTFAPKGTLAAAKEVLVGADDDGKLWRIDETTGAVTQIGSFGQIPEKDGQGNAYDSEYVGENFMLSGDIVFMSNAGNPVGFATVIECKHCGDRVDTLVEIDLSRLRDGNTDSVVKSNRGQVLKSATCDDAAAEGYDLMYGIAAYDAQVYGFSDSGEIVEISNVDGTACRIAQGEDETGTALRFYGAGISTAAKVVVEFN